MGQEGWQQTATFYNLVGSSFNINIGWLPSSRDLISKIGIGLGDYLGIGYFFGKPNSRGDFEVGGISINIGIGLGTPIYIGATYPLDSPIRNIPIDNLYYENQRR